MSFKTINNQSTTNIAVACVDTETEFHGLQGDWKKLLMQCERPVPFLTWEWVSAWWKHFGANSRLFVLVARGNQGNLLGIAPLHVVVRRSFALFPIRSVEFLGFRGSAVCADHMDFLMSCEDREVICAAMVDALIARQREWDVLELADLAEESLLPTILSQMADHSSLPFRLRLQEQCPFLDLPRKWDMLLTSMKAKRRSFIKTKRERLERECSVTFNFNSSQDDVEEQLEILERLHGMARQRKGGAGNFAIRAYREFHHDLARRMAKAGYLYFGRLECHNIPTASVYGFFLGGRLFYYQTGFDPAWTSQGVGSILLALAIEDAIERLHATEFDFLRGNESYKYSWTKNQRLTKTFLLWNRSARALLAQADFNTRRVISKLSSGRNASPNDINSTS